MTHCTVIDVEIVTTGMNELLSLELINDHLKISIKLGKSLFQKSTLMQEVHRTEPKSYLLLNVLKHLGRRAASFCTCLKEKGWVKNKAISVAPEKRRRTMYVQGRRPKSRRGKKETSDGGHQAP